MGAPDLQRTATVPYVKAGIASRGIVDQDEAADHRTACAGDSAIASSRSVRTDARLARPFGVVLIPINHSST